MGRQPRALHFRLNYKKKHEPEIVLLANLDSVEGTVLPFGCFEQLIAI